MVPTPFLLSSDVIRVYVSFCDKDFVARPGYVDLDAQDPTRVLAVSLDPLMDIGVRGSFDENGVLTCSVVEAGSGTLYMYYVGFEQGRKIRYRLLTGLAVSKDGGRTFSRIKRTPVLERSDFELYFRGGPYVMTDGDQFRMWYVAGSDWTELHGKEMPVYDLRYLESEDGINWGPKGRVCLSIEDPDEHGFGRPFVIRSRKGYRLFYSIRKRSLGAYRLGYAESHNGLDWVRKDNELGLGVSHEGWDSEAIMYSAVIDVGGRTYLFYNGNNFGEAGFGVAILESSEKV
jgi:predicted GH43/DUF377 family glycosyl hydrolase